MIKSITKYIYLSMSIILLVSSLAGFFIFNSVYKNDAKIYSSKVMSNKSIIIDRISKSMEYDKIFVMEHYK